jgi:radical SAM protein with 4Fe4S-binding SPASM domain
MEQMISAPLRRLAFSLDGATPATYEAIRVGARFETVVAAIRMAARMKDEARAAFPRLRVNHVLSEMNVDEFPAFLDLVESLGAQGIDVRTAAPYSDAVYKGTSDPAFYEKVRRGRDLLDAFCERTGIENLGILRWQPGRIELFDPSGERQSCRRPWESLGIHANGDVVPCMSWTREPFGNLARQDFESIWNGPALGALRAEFAAKLPGVDCENCVIKRASLTEEDDDFFYRMLAKEPAPASP